MRGAQNAGCLFYQTLAYPSWPVLGVMLHTFGTCRPPKSRDNWVWWGPRSRTCATMVFSWRSLSILGDETTHKYPRWYRAYIGISHRGTSGYIQLSPDQGVHPYNVLSSNPTFNDSCRSFQGISTPRTQPPGFYHWNHPSASVAQDRPDIKGWLDYIVLKHLI